MKSTTNNFYIIAFKYDAEFVISIWFNNWTCSLMFLRFHFYFHKSIFLFNFMKEVRNICIKLFVDYSKIPLYFLILSTRIILNDLHHLKVIILWIKNKCFFKEIFWVNLFSHWLHLNWRSFPHSYFKCLCKFLLYSYLRPQLFGHMNMEFW